MGGVECLDLVAFENSGLAVSSGQVTSGLRSGLGNLRAQANLAASGLGLQGGFHTPRSFTGGQGGFDASGYPVSPGGTVIRPPRL